MLLHVLFRQRFSCEDCHIVALGTNACDDLVNDALGGVCLLVVAERVGGRGRLAFLDGLLGGFKMVLEMRPSLVRRRFIMPFSDVAGEDGRARDNDDTDVN